MRNNTAALHRVVHAWPGPWPLPALWAWAGGWAAWRLAQAAGAGPGLALAVGAASACALAWACPVPRRRAIAAGGFPLSALLLASTGSAWPPWCWLALLPPLLAAYPPRAWRDAPFFPTPRRALRGLDAIVGKPAHVLDAGCGLGHGLAALQALWPQARLRGVEWSPLLAWAAARRCRKAEIRRGDMWAASWAPHDLVYLFQRPESMVRAAAKADAEMRPGSWLVSLEFEVPGRRAAACLRDGGRRPVWVYRIAAPASGSTTLTACR